MLERAKFYIIFNFFKYIFLTLFLFVSLIWISQILRIIELQYSITSQIIDVAFTTLYALPSFINPLVPFLVLIGSLILNYKIRSNNEIIILKQYLSPKDIKFIFYAFMILLFSFFFLNNEFFSTKFYEKYKNKELELRNNLKLGTPSQNEFHIDDIVSIFFEKKENGIFYDVEAVIYNENQFIKSNSVELELSKLKFNLVFNEGERLILNKNEKSKTVFDRFIYTLDHKKSERLYMDKDHFNTIELIKKEEKSFRFHGHNKIVQYFFLIVAGLISLKIIFFYEIKKNSTFKKTSIFVIILNTQILNSYFLYLLNNSNFFSLHYYYIANFILLIFAYYISHRILK